MVVTAPHFGQMHLSEGYHSELWVYDGDSWEAERLSLSRRLALPQGHRALFFDLLLFWGS